jgi:uncharacterized lipoprotein YmbA
MTQAIPSSIPSLTLSRLTAAFFGLLLAACHSAPTRLYSPYPVAPSAAPVRYDGPPLRIDAVNLPPALDRTEVVSNLPGGEVRIHELANWSAPLRESAPRILSADLMGRLPPGKVIYPSLQKPPAALSIAVDVLQFTVDGTHAELQAGWLVSGHTPAAQTPERRGSVVLDRTIAGTAPGTVVEALSSLLGELADRIAAGVTGAGAP